MPAPDFPQDWQILQAKIELHELDLATLEERWKDWAFRLERLQTRIHALRSLVENLRAARTLEETAQAWEREDGPARDEKGFQGPSVIKITRPDGTSDPA